MDEWASVVAAGYLGQAQSGGSLEFFTLAQQLGPQAQTLGSFLCDSLKDDRTLTSDENVNEAGLAVSRVVDEGVARALARNAQLLLKTGLTTAGSLPAFALNDPVPAPDSPLDATNLGNVIKPEFFDSREGGLRLPSPQDPAYASLQQWFYEPSLDNKLLEKSTATNTKIRTAVDSCLAE